MGSYINRRFCAKVETVLFVWHLRFPSVTVGDLSTSLTCVCSTEKRWCPTHSSTSIWIMNKDEDIFFYLYAVATCTVADEVCSVQFIIHCIDTQVYARMHLCNTKANWQTYRLNIVEIRPRPAISNQQLQWRTELQGLAQNCARVTCLYTSMSQSLEHHNGAFYWVR